MTKSDDNTTTEASAEPVTQEAETAAAPRIRAASDVVEPTEADADDAKMSDALEGSDALDGSEADGSEDAEASDDAGDSDEPTDDGGSIQWSRVVAYGILPGLALILALTAGFLKFVDNSVRDSNTASIESVQAAKDGTVALLSYKPETVEKQLGDARNLLTGDFQKSYTDLTTNVVIPGAKQQQISASARVPAAAAVSADLNHAVVLLFVNQTVVVGQGAPSDTASSVRVTLDKVDGKWLISKFDPV